MLVKDAMVMSVISIAPQATLREAAETMLARGVDTLFVMEDGQLVGVVGLRDLFTAPLRASWGSRMSEQRTEKSLTQVWRGHIVGNIMDTRVLTVPTEMALTQAAALMVNSGKHPLLVRQDGRFIGAISRADVMRALLGDPQARDRE
jgi:CBS domain-containing protein